MILGLKDTRPREKSPFKFINQWAEHEDFQDIARRIWQQPIARNFIFQLSSKLIKLKQQQLRAKHRSRLWLTLGDHNTRFFHRSLIHRNARNGISRLEDANGIAHTSNLEMGDIATNQHPYDGNVANLYPKATTEEDKDTMKLLILNKEIKDALFSIPNDKAPRPNGYTSLFLKKAWATFGANFTAAPCGHQVDQQFWESNTTGMCTLQSVWEQVRTTWPQEGGSKLIWHKWHIPRHSFILWLASRGRLRTMDRFYNQTQPQALCLLCESQVEDHNHLFSKCTYSAEVWCEISLKTQVSWPSIPWRQAWEWAIASYGTGHHTKDDIIHMVKYKLANIRDRDELHESI
ncbi:hypothetical protein SADUNF_Sadunf06G0134500 [Salix dunnii]|uniref:Reverse transcriptase zinc-binding domain-containing protein n=1 Tax=Salix dunnii TaxID=1413687 RepID=A0A835K4M5_9ROSI|nr:hypothetical protein SADUNF_Sadunf06G0134500 [Salix dunnii]